MGRRIDDDDDDDWGRLERRTADDSGSALKIVGIVGAVILAIVLVCGGVAVVGIYMVVTAADRARQDLQKQLDKVIEEEQRKQRELQEQQRKQLEKAKA